MTRPHLPRWAGLTMIACAASSAIAQTPPPPPDAPATAATLGEIKVKGQGETANGPVVGYRAQRSATATKTDTKLSETPQSVTVVTRDLVVDQGATNLQDALNYAAGVRSDAYGLDSRTDSAIIRGGYPDEYLDGLRKNFDYYTSNTRTEPYTLERIEVLRGPAGMLFGQGTTGGVINMVSKRPQATRQNELGIQYGSWQRRQVHGDFTGPIGNDGEWMYRVVGVVRDANTQVDHVRDDRRLLAPSFTWQPSARTSLTLQALTQHDRTGSTSQFFPWSGTLTANPNGQLPTNRFIGELDDRYDTDRQFVGWLFQHELDNGWMLRQNTRYTVTDNVYQSIYGDSFTAPGDWALDPVDKRVLGRSAFASQTKTRLFTIDQQVQGRIDTGPVRHDVLFGIDMATYRNRSASRDGTADPIDAYAPIYGNYALGPLTDNAPFRQRQLGIYAQDQLRFARNWLVTLGLRHDKARNQTDALNAVAAKNERSSATTKRLGLMYTLPQGIAPYISYAESFTPIANIQQFSFKPKQGKQWEAGVKFEPTDGKTTLNVAVYRLKEVNLVTETTPNVYEQLDQTKNRGVEVELKTELIPHVQLLSNYTYTEVDEQLEQVPRHNGSLWAKWDLGAMGLTGFSLGAGVRAMNAYHDGAGPTVPRLTLFDAMVAWENSRWRAALNIGNVGDKIYNASCGSRGDCWYGTRRNAIASATYKF